MSDTPRTDAEEYYPHCSKSTVCNASFCRQLERELNTAQQRIKRLEEMLWLSQPVCEAKEAKP